MKNKYVLESLASDLKRVAIGLHRGSNKMSERFLNEALKRKNELIQENVPLYIKKLLNNLDRNIDSDYALMCSILIQNYSQTLAPLTIK